VLANNEALISYFDSKQAALRGRALAEETRDGLGRRSRVAVLAREADGSRSPYDVPAQAPLGAVAGLVLGGLLGSVAGEAGVVVGLFFGWYAGLLADLWRRLARCDLLDRIQDGLAPGRAALVTFVGVSAAGSVERSLAATDAVTVHRFPHRRIEEDLAREVREAAADVASLVEAEVGDRRPVNTTAVIAAARRRLSVLDAVSSRLLWLEQQQFESDVRIINRERHEAPRWRAALIRARLKEERAAHRRRKSMLGASLDGVRAATELAVRCDGA